MGGGGLRRGDAAPYIYIYIYIYIYMYPTRPPTPKTVRIKAHPFNLWAQDLHVCSNARLKLRLDQGAWNMVRPEAKSSCAFKTHAAKQDLHDQKLFEAHAGPFAGVDLAGAPLSRFPFDLLEAENLTGGHSLNHEVPVMPVVRAEQALKRRRCLISVSIERPKIAALPRFWPRSVSRRNLWIRRCFLPLCFACL